MSPDHTGQCNISLVIWTLGHVGPLRHANGHAKQEPPLSLRSAVSTLLRKVTNDLLVGHAKGYLSIFFSPDLLVIRHPLDTLIFSNSPPSPRFSPSSLVLSLATSFYSTGLQNLEFEKVCVPLILPDSTDNFNSIQSGGFHCCPHASES